MPGISRGKLDTAPINPDPNTPKTYDLVMSRISKCLETHSFQQGGSSVKSFRPTRLLHVSCCADKYDTALVTSAQSDYVDYVALSYCWGGDQLHKTTKARIQSINSGILYSELPATLQDAVKVTLGLGYNYLWVDSLCIIQDDEADKTREIATMPSIYNNAVVTNAAMTASSASKGFLHLRKTKRPIIRTVALRDALGQTLTLSMVEVDRSEYTETSPLDTRAWAMQEALLSARILSYYPQ
jgi:hypothetical protein